MKTGYALVSIVVIAVGGYLLLSRVSQSKIHSSTDTTATNVVMESSQQVVTIAVKGGYSPQKSFLKAGVPTILRFQTKGTFDCASAIQIPSLSISKNLPATGTTDIPVGSLQVGTIQGTCAMGMYRFELEVEG